MVRGLIVTVRVRGRIIYTVYEQVRVWVRGQGYTVYEG